MVSQTDWHATSPDTAVKLDEGQVFRSETVTPAATWWAVTIAVAALLAALGPAVVSIRTARRGGGDEPTG